MLIAEIPFRHCAKTGIFFLLLFATVAVRAQRDWQPAAVILTDGTRLTGHINDRNWNGEIRQIAFRPDGAVKPVTYTPQDLSFFELAGIHYRSLEVEVDGAPANDTDLQADFDYPRLSKRAIVRTVLDGPVSLLLYVGPQQRRHYFLSDTTGAELTYLEYRPRLVTLGEKRVLQHGGDFRKTLNAMLSPECPQLIQDIVSVAYTEQDLVRLLELYYACSGIAAPDQRPSRQPRLSLEAMGELQSVSFSDIYYTWNQTMSDEREWYTAVGLRLRLTPPLFNYRSSLFVGGAVDKMTISGADVTKREINGFVQHYRVPERGYRVDAGAGYQIYQGTFRLGLTASYEWGVGRKTSYEVENFVDGQSTFLFPINTYDGGANIAFTAGVTGGYGPVSFSLVNSWGKRQSPRLNLFSFQRIGVSLAYTII